MVILVPVPTIITTPIAYIKVAPVKQLEAGSRDERLGVPQSELLTGLSSLQKLFFPFTEYV